MAVERFGVTAQIIMDLFQKSLPASVIPIIERWIDNAAGRLALMLQQQNFTSAQIVALGVDSPAYQICNDYVQIKAGARAHQSFARNQTALADGFHQEARELGELIKNMAAVLDPNRDRNELRGTFRGSAGAAVASLGAPIAARSWARRIQLSQTWRRARSGGCARWGW